jgi:hypothetical protein
MKQFRTMLLGSAAMSMAAMAAMPAEAAEVERTLKMSGYVNKVAAFVDDGDSTYTDFVDSGLEKSRVRWIAEAKGPNFTMGGIIELGLMINNSQYQSQVQSENGGTDTGTLEGRRAAVYIKSKKFGTLNLGKYQSASDGVVEADLSGTDISAINGEYAGVEGTTYRFLPEDTDMGGAGNNTFPTGAIDMSTVIEQLDGIQQSGGRPNGVRYTSPSFMGASLRFGTYEGGSTDVALHYSAKLFDGTAFQTEVDARVAGWNTSGNTTNSDGGYGGSISALHSSGVSLTFAGAEQDDNQEDFAGAKDPNNLYTKVGYQFKYLNLGKTSLSGSWQENNDFGGTNQTVTVWGANIVQNFDAYGTEIYGGYANFDLETGNSDVREYEDIDAGWVGMRVKF